MQELGAAAVAVAQNWQALAKRNGGRGGVDEGGEETGAMHTRGRRASSDVGAIRSIARDRALGAATEAGVSSREKSDAKSKSWWWWLPSERGWL